MFLIRGAESIPRALIPGYFRSRQHLPSVAAVKAVAPIGQGAHEEPHGGRASIALGRYKAQEQTQESEVLYARHIMTAPVFTLSPESTLRQATRAFTEHRYRHIPITNSRREVVGLISDRDVLRFRAEHLGAQEHESLGTLMVKEVLIATPDTLVREIARTMFHERIGSLPIVDNEGALEGIITRSDIIRSLIAYGPTHVLA